MKIFVGYGFNASDRWIEDMIFPLIRSYGDEVLTGENLQGQAITDGVRRKIEEADAVIGFLTRRGDPDGAGTWNTHRWVSDEMALASGRGIPVLEVREEGVADQGGIVGDRQRLPYGQGTRDRFLVELAKTLGTWHQKQRVRLQVLPETLAAQVSPRLGQPGLRAVYRLLVDGDEGPDVQAKILPIKGGLFIIAREVPRDAMIQMQIEFAGELWASSYENVDSLGIRLERRGS